MSDRVLSAEQLQAIGERLELGYPASICGVGSGFHKSLEDIGLLLASHRALQQEVYQLRTEIEFCGGSCRAVWLAPPQERGTEGESALDEMGRRLRERPLGLGVVEASGDPNTVRPLPGGTPNE